MSRIKVLQVVAGGRRFALDVGIVQGIERPRRWARLPLAPPYVLGVCEFAGAAVAVVDLALRLGLEAGPDQGTAGVVLLDSAEPVGLSVEAIEGVGEIDLAEGIDLGPTGQAAGARGIARDGRILLESEPLVDARPLTSLREVLGQAWKEEE